MRYQTLPSNATRQEVQDELLSLPPRLVKRITKIVTAKRARILRKEANISRLMDAAYSTHLLILVYNIVTQASENRLAKLANGWSFFKDVAWPWIKQAVGQLNNELNAEEILDILLGHEDDTDEEEAAA